MCYYMNMSITRAGNVRQWRRTINDLSEKTGITLEEVCTYAGLTYNGPETAVYKKIPKKRRAFIGIGMAYGMPLETINEWIQKYGGKRRLYVKDISEDLVWIYLIEANTADRESGKNYYSLYEKCQSVAYATWKELWDELTLDPQETVDVEIELENVDYDNEFCGLRRFITDHMDSFKMAYSKPRKYLDSYVDLILDSFKRKGKSRVYRLSDLRGWLDDSMINYLSGDSEKINVIDKKSHKRTMRIKQMPKNKRVHTSMCLALGMGKDETNRYLEMMGFAPLDEGGEQEQFLSKMLEEWESKHPQAYELKKRISDDPDDPCMLADDKRREAAEEMLMLRQELREAYAAQGLDFPYMKLREANGHGIEE